MIEVIPDITSGAMTTTLLQPAGQTEAIAGTAAPTVFLVDDDPAIRESVTKLAASVGLRVEAFASGPEFLEAFDPGRSGCLMLDVRMPRMSGLELHRRLNEAGSKLPVLFVTAFGDVPTAVQSLHDGATDFLEKPTKPHVLLDAIQRAIQTDLERRRREASLATMRQRVAKLSRRECEVLRMLARGQTLKAIAEELGLSPKTAHTHLTRVRKKLGAKSMAELIRTCLAVGLVEAP